MTCLPTVIPKIPSHDRLPHDDCEQRELQCSQDDAERDACSKITCISDESGGCGEVVIADDLAGIVVRMDVFCTVCFEPGVSMHFIISFVCV